MNPKSFWILLGPLVGALLGFSCVAAEIHDAIRAGALARVKALGKSDPHQLDLADGRAGQPPLHVSAQLGRTNILKYLLDQKVPVDSTNYLGQTALHYVDFVGNRSSPEEIFVTVQILIANGANVNAVDRTDETPLHYFAADGQIKLAEMALERGAKVSYGNGHPNGTPLVQAARRGRD